MPPSVRFSRRALAEVQGIVGWITEQADRETALAYAGRLQEACLRIADHPNGGTPRDAVSRGLRSIVFERRIRIFYRVGKNEVVIARIVHGSRDLKRVFRRRPSK